MKELLASTSQIRRGPAAWVFLLYIVSVAIMRPAFPIASRDVVPSDAIFLLVLVAIALSPRIELASWQWHRWHAALAAYVIACAIAALMSTDRRDSLIKIAAVGYLTTVGFLASQYARDAVWRRRMIAAFLTGALVTVAGAAIGAALFYSGRRDNLFLYSYGSLIPGPYPRPMGLFLNANVMCSFMVAAIIIGYDALRSSPLSAVLRNTFLALCTVTAVMSLSPGIGGLGLAVAWRARTLFVNPMLRRAAVVAGSLGAIAMLLAATISPTIFLDRPVADALQHLEPSSRVLAWRGTIETISQHPFFGAGPGQPVTHTAYLSASGGNEMLTDAHNMFLSVMGENGAIAFAAFMAILLLPLLRKATGIAATLQLALICGVIYPSLTGSFEDSRHTWVLLGLLAGAIDAGESDRNHT